MDLAGLPQDDEEKELLFQLYYAVSRRGGYAVV